jgi:hypothetical protein
VVNWVEFFSPVHWHDESNSDWSNQFLLPYQWYFKGLWKNWQCTLCFYIENHCIVALQKALNDVGELESMIETALAREWWNIVWLTKSRVENLVKLYSTFCTLTTEVVSVVAVTLQRPNIFNLQFMQSQWDCGSTVSMKPQKLLRHRGNLLQKSAVHQALPVFGFMAFANGM